MAAIALANWQLKTHVKTEQPITTSSAWEGKLVTADLSGTVTIWDPKTAKVLKSQQFGGGNTLFNCATVLKGNLYFQTNMPSNGNYSWPIVKMDPTTLQITAQYPLPTATSPLFAFMVADVSNIWGLTMKGQVTKMDPDDLSVIDSYDPGMPGGSANVLLNVEEALAIGGSEGQVNLFLKKDWISLGSIETQYGDLSLNELPGGRFSVSNLSGEQVWYYAYDVPPTLPYSTGELSAVGYANVALQNGSSLFIGAQHGVALYNANPFSFQRMLSAGQSNTWMNLVQIDPHTVISTGDFGWDLFSDQGV